MAFNIGEQVVWARVDETTGKKLNNLVIIRNINMLRGRPMYLVQMLAGPEQGEVAQAFDDELYRVARK